MNLRIYYLLILVLFVSSCSESRSNKKSVIAEQPPPVKCMENSPERRGEEGCTILANRPLLGSPTKTIYWHIDRFDSLEAAKKAASPDGVAAEAHGSATPVHKHSGPEVIYIVDGEQCMETPEVGQRLGPGQSYLVQSGGVHRGRVTGSGVRRALALILYDAGQPASHDLVDPPQLVQCK